MMVLVSGCSELVLMMMSSMQCGTESIRAVVVCGS